MNDLKALETEANKLVALAKKAGATACDVVLASGDSLSVEVRDGQVEKSDRSESNSLSLRVFCDKKIASVTSNTQNNLEKLAEQAVAMAKVSPEDEYQGLAEESRLLDASEMDNRINELDLLDVTEPQIKRMEQSAFDAEKAGLGIKGVSKSMGSGMGWSRSGFVLATSDGFSGSYERSGFSISCSLVSGEGTGMERDYDYDTAIHLEDLKAAEIIGKAAAERVVKRAGPVQVASGTFPIVCDPRISTGILGTMMGAINASAVARKTSFLRDEMGKQVATAGIQVIDDPRMVRRSGSKPFDGEGVATDRIDFVKDGVLQQWLLDSATARELSLETNGRAGRGGTGTSPSTTNCYMKPGNQTPEELIKDIPDGLYLTETIGHGINMVTGDYSKGAAGFWIKNGEITHPVAEITVAGNLKEMFLNMHPANDLVFKYGTNAPTLLIEGMTIGGL